VFGVLEDCACGDLFCCFHVAKVILLPKPASIQRKIFFTYTLTACNTDQ
jgi:hypothetical protein